MDRKNTIKRRMGYPEEEIDDRSLAGKIFDKVLSFLIVALAVVIAILAVTFVSECNSVYSDAQIRVCPTCFVETKSSACEECNIKTVLYTDVIECPECDYYIFYDTCDSCGYVLQEGEREATQKENLTNFLDSVKESVGGNKYANRNTN